MVLGFKGLPPETKLTTHSDQKLDLGLEKNIQIEPIIGSLSAI